MHGSYESKCVHPDELDALNKDNIISGGRRTRGIRVDYTKVAADPKGQHDDSEPETETKVPKNKEAVQKPGTRSPERKKETNVEKKGGEEEEGGEDEGELDEDEGLDDEDSDDSDSDSE